MKGKGGKEMTGRSCYTSCCKHVKTKWPIVLLVFSFTFLFLIVLFKWVALDWIINYKIAEVIQTCLLFITNISLRNKKCMKLFGKWS